MPAHNERLVLPGRRLGWKRKDPARPVLRLRRYLAGVAVTPHPAVVDHYSKVPSWILGENDQYGTCGPTSGGNHLLLTTSYLSPTALRATDAQVIDLYKRSGNPNFPAQDDGVDMTVMLSAMNKGGIAGQRSVAFAAVDPHNLDELRLAIDVFGGVLYGAMLDVAQQSQTDMGIWDHVTGSAEWGGHAFLVGHYESQARRDGQAVTWAELVAMTTSFEQRQVEEAYVVIWPWNLGTTQFEQNVNLAQLAKDYTEITGRPFPAPVPSPAPSPAPTPPTPPPAPPSGLVQWLEALLAWLRSWGFK